MWMGPHTYKRDHSRVNGTTHFWTKPEDYQLTNGGPFTPDGLFTRGGTDYTWRTTDSQYPTYERDVYVCLRVAGSSTCERDMYVWTGPVLVKHRPRVDETSTCELNEMSTCEWILDKRLKFRRLFLHVLTRHKENYTCRLKLNLFFLFRVLKSEKCWLDKT